MGPAISARRQVRAKSSRIRAPRRTLAIELLEPRSLLSAIPASTIANVSPPTDPVVQLVSTAFKTLGFSSAGHVSSGDVTLNGTVAYTSPVLGTIDASMTGYMYQVPGGGPVRGSCSLTQDSSNPANPQNLSGTVTIQMPFEQAGTNPCTGNLDTSTFAARFYWWGGVFTPTDATAFDIRPTAPQWHSSAHTQIDFNVVVDGAWHSVDPAKCGTPLAYVHAYWASGTTQDTILGGVIAGDTIPIYWNQAAAAASIDVPSIPLGANFVLISVEDDPRLLTDENTGNNLVAMEVSTVADRAGRQIVGDGQPGFWSSSNTTWSNSRQGRDGGSLTSSTLRGSKQSMAAWWFSMPAGTYDLAVTYSAGSNLTTHLGLDLYDGVGNWIGQIPVNERVAPSDFTDQGVSWKRLGSVKLTNNLFHISTWNSPTDGAIGIDAIRMRAAALVDNGDPAGVSNGCEFATSGGWAPGTQGAYGGSAISSSAAGSGSSTASWTFPVAPGSYEVDATWAAAAGLSATVTYNIADGTTPLGSVTVNQQSAPTGTTQDGALWQTLGHFLVSGAQVTVTVANGASDGQVAADAVRLLPDYQPMPIVSNGYPGFSCNAAAWDTVSPGLYGDALVSNTANGSRSSMVAWWFPCRPGDYDVQVTWQPGSNLSASVPLDVYNGRTWIRQAVVNQQRPPTGVPDQGVTWQSLGVFTMTGNVLHVSTWNSPTDGAICADGIRIVPVGT